MRGKDGVLTIIFLFGAISLLAILITTNVILGCEISNKRMEKLVDDRKGTVHVVAVE